MSRTRQWVCILIAFSPFILLFTLAAVLPMPEHHFRGSVSNSGKPLENASVEIEFYDRKKYKAKTDKNGKYIVKGRFDSSEAETIAIKKRGYVSRSVSISDTKSWFDNYTSDLFLNNDLLKKDFKEDIYTNNYVVSDIKLAKKSNDKKAIKGYIGEKGSGKPLYGIEISLYKGTNKTSGCHVTKISGKDGKYSFKASSGYYTLVIKDKDYGINVKKNICLDKNINLNPIVGEKKNCIF